MMFSTSTKILNQTSRLFVFRRPYSFLVMSSKHSHGILSKTTVELEKGSNDPTVEQKKLKKVKKQLLLV